MPRRRQPIARALRLDAPSLAQGGLAVLLAYTLMYLVSLI